MPEIVEICSLCQPTIMEGETPSENHCTTLSIVRREALNTYERYVKDGTKLLKLTKPGDFATIRTFSEILKDLDKKIGLAERNLGTKVGGFESKLGAATFDPEGELEGVVDQAKGRSFFCTLDMIIYKNMRSSLEQKIEEFKELEEYIFKKKMEYIMQSKKQLNSRKL